MQKRGAKPKIVFILIIAVILIGLIIGFIFLFPNLNLTQQGGKVYSVSEQCDFACESTQKTAFCDVKRKVTDELKLTCDELASNSQYSKYNVKPCPTISC